MVKKKLAEKSWQGPLPKGYKEWLASTNSTKKTTTGKTTSSEEQTTSSITKEQKSVIETEVKDNIMDFDLISYQFYRDAIGNAEKSGKTMFFDSTDPMPLSTMTYGQQEINRGLLVKNTRWITFNIPAIDALSRSNPLVKKAVNYLSSKPLINGIDINSSKLTSEEIYRVNRFYKNQYASLRQWLSKGINYGGSGGILWFKGDDNRDLDKPLLIKNIKKGSFTGVKPLSRWFQIEPDLTSSLIQDVDYDRGIYDARLIGMPEYYNVSLDGGLVGDGSRKQYKVHISRLIIFNAEMPSFIETQIERYWGASIIELAWNDLNIDHRLWRATAKTLDKNNMGIMKIDGLGLAGSQMSTTQRNKWTNRMALLKEGSVQGVLTIDGKDEFEFANAVLTGYSDILNIDHRRLAGSFRVPLSVLFPSEKSDDEDRLYLQSLSELSDTQELYIRPALNMLLPVIVKSEIGRSVDDLTFTFNPIETQTLKDKADMFKIMSDGLEVLKRIGAIDTSSAIRMVDDINKNPLNISQNITKGYREKILAEAEQGIFHTQISETIEIAEVTSALAKENGKGISGGKNPSDNETRTSKGGNPKVKSKPIERNVMNRDKAKE
jgi:phage-related protein (TIGR01555 family)